MLYSEAHFISISIGNRYKAAARCFSEPNGNTILGEDWGGCEKAKINTMSLTLNPRTSYVMDKWIIYSSLHTSTTVRSSSSIDFGWNPSLSLCVQSVIYGITSRFIGCEWQRTNMCWKWFFSSIFNTLRGAAKLLFSISSTKSRFQEWDGWIECYGKINHSQSQPNII